MNLGWTEDARIPEAVGKVKIIVTININQVLIMCKVLCSSLHALSYLIVLNSLFILIIYLRKLRHIENKFSQGHMLT